MRERSDQIRVHGYDRVTLLVRGHSLPSGLTPARLPRERERHTVVVAAEPALDVPTLVTLLRRHLPVRCGSIRLVLSDSGQPGIAQPLADELGMEVIAPAGPVMLLPTGALFVVDGQWWRFRPGEPAERQGARHPAPRWERLLPRGLRALPPELRATAVPAGLWLHDADPPVPALTTAVLAAPVDPARLTVVVGRPGRGSPPELLYPVLEALPRALRRGMVLVPCDGNAGTAHTLGEWLAARTGGTVDVLAGLDADAPADPAAPVRNDGRQGWRSFAQRVVYRAGAAPQVVRWRDPLPGAAGTAGVQRVDVDWAVEVVRSGLWLRSAGDDPEQDRIRRLPVDDRQPVLVLGAAAVARPPRDLPTLNAVLDGLPAETRASLRLAVTRMPAETDGALWAPLVERYGPLLTVVGPGHLIELPGQSQAGSEPHPEPGHAPGPGRPAEPHVARDPVPVPAAPGSTAETAIGPESPLSKPATEPVPAPQRRPDFPVLPDPGEGRYTGAVFSGWPSDQPARWQPGEEVRTSEALTASTVPWPRTSGRRGPAGPTLVIWSVTGRRVADPTSPGAEGVRFEAGSRMRIVDVAHLGRDAAALVLLREVIPDAAGGPKPAYDPIHDDALDRRARTALRRAVDAARRATGADAWSFSPGRG
ncbi:hypothetical protein AB0J86_22395 [Micromonospora sp. NPDC049559]|uniref:hypothetical protein n=1 Tax=Micromonospora sp. NPDC049559 TaxID=3155923 RepID=UPI003431823B